jgi:N-methylhydantoinase A/oxoprolinase/acetone carboxylase beta subunit
VCIFTCYAEFCSQLSIVRAPSIDVRTVGAGGGSIATVAEITGALRVGPESAGASPGTPELDLNNHIRDEAF